VDTKKDLHEELKMQLAEVVYEFLHRLDITWSEFKTQLAEGEDQSDYESCWRTGTGIGMAQPPKFDESISCLEIIPALDTIRGSMEWKQFPLLSF
jgi:hypothetical protein